MILKIQRSLFGESSLLIYDKPIPDGEYGTHEVFAQISSTAQEISAILGEDLKGYFEADVEKGSVIIGKRLPDQDW